MSNRDNLYTGEDARNGLMNGIRKTSEAVALTMGTAGKNSLIETLANPGSYPTNDGFSIANAIRLANPLEEMGRRKLVEAINRANKQNGDGSSTTCVLTSAILEEGMKHLDKAQPMEIMKSLNDCLPLIEKSLKNQRKEIIDPEGNIDFERVKQVATISAESEEIGKIIAEIYKKIGKDGVVSWEVSGTGNDYFEIGSGIKMEDTTYATRWMCDEDGGGPGLQAIMKNPYILLAQSKITSEKEIEKLYGELVGQGIKELVIFTNEMEEPVLNSLTVARLPNSQGGVGFRFLVIKMPTVFNDLWWEDLAKASGGRLINKASGIRMKDVGMDMLGHFDKITATPTHVLIDGIQDLTTHILAFKVDGSEMALARAARLNTKTARYFVGGLSDSTIRQRRDKVEDAINSAWGAMQNGILPGGGVALREARENLKEGIGKEILDAALLEPTLIIMRNAGIGSDIVYGMQGYDTKTRKVVDMFEAGIVDSFDVVFGAIKSAIGVAAGVLTCGTVVLLPKENNDVIGQIAEKVGERMSIQR